MTLGSSCLSRRDTVCSSGIALWAAAVALAPSPFSKLLICAPVLVFGLAYWMFGRADRWLTAFFAAAILLPPMPIALGDSGPHIAPAFALIGLLMILLSLPQARLRNARLLLLFLFFLSALLQSLLFAALFSGPEVALLSFLRVVLFALAPLVFFYTSIRQPPYPTHSIRLARLLFRFSIAAALFACLDFYYQLPSPGGYGPQFVWLENAVLRRAQGLFYEASTLGNFCAFFLVLVMVALCYRREVRLCSRLELGLGALVLATALVFSYSRGSLLNVVGAAAALVWIRKGAGKRLLFAGLAGAVIVAGLVYLMFPSFSHNYWLRLEASFLYLHSAPGAVLSGRLRSWDALMQFLVQRPLHVLFGIGYKTLPYSSYLGSSMIADNTYLSLLVETGLLGLGAFVVLNIEMLKSSFRAARSSGLLARFFGTWFFCFWVGELMQMLSGDLITYWRILPLFFWSLAVALRHSGHSGDRESVSPVDATPQSGPLAHARGSVALTAAQNPDRQGGRFDILQYPAITRRRTSRPAQTRA